MKLGLAFAALAWIAGCAASQPRHLATAPAPAVHPARVVEPDQPHPARAAAERELGPQTAAALPPIEHAPPEPVDPGAHAIIDSMLPRIADRITDADGVTWIGLGQLRNQSRATADEFIAFRQRLAELLTRAGRDDQLHFTADAAASVQYQLLGTAYLITAGGIDQWQLFLSLSPARNHITLWQPDSPVHVLRDPRPGSPQILWAGQAR